MDDVFPALLAPEAAALHLAQCRPVLIAAESTVLAALPTPPAPGRVEAAARAKAHGIIHNLTAVGVHSLTQLVAPCALRLLRPDEFRSAFPLAGEAEEERYNQLTTLLLHLSLIHI